MPSDSPLIILAGGGTGGHATPLASLHARLSPHHPSWRWRWMGEKHSIEERIAAENSIPFSPIFAGKLRRYFSLRTLVDPCKNLVGIFQVMWIFWRERPCLIFSKWWYVSLPTIFAGALLGIPVFLHESDSVPGLANRIAGRFAERIFLGFSSASGYFSPQKTEIVWQILCDRFTGERVQREDDARPRLLVICGSQGSARIFSVLLQAPEIFFWYDTTIILGTLNAEYRTQFEAYDVTVYDFVDPQTLADIYARTDIAITRASATTLSELALYAVRMCIIPLRITSGQVENAEIYCTQGHEILDERTFDARTLAMSIDRLASSSGDFETRDDISAAKTIESHIVSLLQRW